MRKRLYILLFILCFLLSCSLSGCATTAESSTAPAADSDKVPASEVPLEGSAETLPTVAPLNEAETLLLPEPEANPVTTALRVEQSNTPVVVLNAEGQKLSLCRDQYEGDMEVIERVPRGAYGSTESYNYYVVPYSTSFTYVLNETDTIELGLYWGYGEENETFQKVAVTGARSVRFTQEGIRLNGTDIEFSLRMMGENCHQLRLSGKNATALDISYKNDTATISCDTDVVIETYDLSTGTYYLQDTLPGGRKGTVLNISDGANATLEVE